VSLYFPALEAAPEAAAAGVSTDKVLVVDDQPEVLEVTCELFRAMGFEVLSANSGEDALGVLARTPDLGLMLSDVVMPGMTGVQLARRAQADYPALKVILASGYAAPALEGGGGDSLDGFQFLPKPYRMGDLVKAVQALG
jgi:CheY-like chemotaxis protein